MAENKTFQVPNIGCNGCLSTIKSELGEMAGINKVDGDVPTKTVTVEWDSPANWDSIVAKLTALEYAPAEA
jgi:copper chaperone CopZ